MSSTSEISQIIRRHSSWVVVECCGRTYPRRWRRGRSRGSGVKYGDETTCIGRVEELDMSGSWGRMNSSAASGVSYASASSFISSSSPLTNAVHVSRSI
jgi:hypothetical protein